MKGKKKGDVERTLLRSGDDQEHRDNKKINKEEFGGNVTSGHLLGRCLTLRKKKRRFSGGGKIKTPKKLKEKERGRD